jgi:hypothetical protein
MTRPQPRGYCPEARSRGAARHLREPRWMIDPHPLRSRRSPATEPLFSIISPRYPKRSYMSTQILRKRRTLAMKRLALAAISASFFVLSGTTLGADVGIANPSAVAAALGGRYATAHPTESPAVNAKTHSAFVDGLYKELIDWTPPPCLSSDTRPTTTRPTVRSFFFPP